jgi:23S rRNA (pseudouridine1915-N3)-methyltransferase
MRLRLLCVGKDRSGLFEPAAREYASRIARYVRFEEVIVPASKRREPDRAKSEEADEILSRLDDDETLVALDERGQEMDSRGFAALLSRLQASGRNAALAVGGDDGLADSVRKRASLTVSLSRMTLPHRLARVVVLEQMYRGFTILRREPYHR